MHVAAWYFGIPGSKSPDLENKCPLARSLTLPNLVAVRQEVCDICAVENLSSRKSGPKFTNIADNLLGCCALIPLIVPNFIALGQKRCTRKAFQFFKTLKYFGAPGGSPRRKFTILGSDVQQCPFDQPAKFRPVVRTRLRDSCCQISISLTA